jgi:dephospho-CoA kinase
LDRPKLGRLVFSDPDALAALNAIVHPLIAARSAELTAQVPAEGVVVYDVPLLVENGRQGDFDAVIVVQAPLEARLARLARRGLSEQEARERMAHQADDEKRRAVASVVLDNGGSIDRLRAQVDAAWSALVGGAAGEVDVL